MLRKIFICVLALTSFLIAACGEEKVVGTPDKAILAYCETVTMGESPNLTAAGFTEDDNKNLRKMILRIFEKSFTEAVPLSDESAETLAKTFYENNKAKLTFQTKIKTEDKELPVVELTATPLDISKANSALENNNEIFALLGMVGKLRSDGATDEQLKENSEVQALAVTAFGKYIEGIPVQSEKVFEVPCKKVTAPNGNAHWVPDDVNALMDFLMGKK